MSDITGNNHLKEFGIWFSKLRLDSGYKSQRQLALDSDVSPTTLSRIESGIQKAEPDTLAKLAPYLKSSFEELMTKAGYPVRIDESNLKEPKKPADLRKLLEQREILFDGVPVRESVKQQILDIVEFDLYKMAKEMNKRKKSTKDGDFK